MMERITYIDLAGTSYPLNFSTKAAKIMSSRYGSLTGIGNAFDNKKPDELIDEVIFILSVLLDQGAAYMKLTGGQNAPVLSPDDLEVIVGIPDLAGLKDVVMKAMTAGSYAAIATENNPKNAETTQETK